MKMKLRWIHFLFAASVLAPLSIVPVSTVRAADDDHPDKDVEEKQVASYPELPPCDAIDALQVHIEKNQLLVLTKLPNTVGPARVKIRDLPGLTVVNIRWGDDQKPKPADSKADSKADSPAIFNFEKWDFSQPHCTKSINVQVTNMNVQFAQVVEYADGTNQQFSLIQTPPDFSDGNIGVHLRVSEQNANTDIPSNNLELTATDFLALRREHPKEVAKYLEPILRDLKTESSIFCPDRKLSFQIFLEDAPRSPAIFGKLNAILTRLDADEFRDRENAAKDLSALGEPAVVELIHLDRSRLSPEQKSRVDAFLAPYRPVSEEEAGRLAREPNFLIDCLYDTDPFIVNSALKHLRKLKGESIVFDVSSKDQIRDVAIAHLRAELNPATQPNKPE